MSDLISRQAAIEAVSKACLELRGVFERCKDALEALASAYPERKAGRWVIDGHHIQCDQCGITMCNTDREGDWVPRNFCPNCGADMRGEENG